MCVTLISSTDPMTSFKHVPTCCVRHKICSMEALHLHRRLRMVHVGYHRLSLDMVYLSYARQNSHDVMSASYDTAFDF